MDTFRDKAGGPIGTDIDTWVRSFTRMESGSSELPPHHPNCLGCGPENPNGHFLSVRRDGDGVVAHHQFDQRHVGAPGIAHGGAVATVIDDLFGFFELEYLAPALLDTPYILRAAVRSRDGRKLDLTSTMEDAEGRTVITATALFIVVEVEHFLQSQRNSRA